MIIRTGLKSSSSAIFYNNRHKKRLQSNDCIETEIILRPLNLHCNLKSKLSINCVMDLKVLLHFSFSVPVHWWIMNHGLDVDICKISSKKKRCTLFFFNNLDILKDFGFHFDIVLSLIDNFRVNNHHSFNFFCYTFIKRR